MNKNNYFFIYELKTISKHNYYYALISHCFPLFLKNDFTTNSINLRPGRYIWQKLNFLFFYLLQLKEINIHIFTSFDFNCLQLEKYLNENEEKNF